MEIMPRATTPKSDPRKRLAVKPIGDEPFGENLLPGIHLCNMRCSGKSSVGGQDRRNHPPKVPFVKGDESDYPLARGLSSTIRPSLMGL
jgi:hypothetical protein